MSRLGFRRAIRRAPELGFELGDDEEEEIGGWRGGVG